MECGAGYLTFPDREDRRLSNPNAPPREQAQFGAGPCSPLSGSPRITTLADALLVHVESQAFADPWPARECCEAALSRNNSGPDETVFRHRRRLPETNAGYQSRIKTTEFRQ